MPNQKLGDPPNRPGTAATCPDCTNPIDTDARRCSACGSRVWSKGQAVLLVAFSMPLWSITVGAISMLGSVDSAAARGFLFGVALLGPLTTLAGVGKYRERDQSLRGGA